MNSAALIDSARIGAAHQDAAHIEDLAAFVAASPSSYHAAAEVARRLVAAGYVELDEADDWTPAIVPGARVVIVRDGAVVALSLPEAVTAITPYRIVGTHTDSPGFKLKPRPTLTPYGWQVAAVEVYSSPILPSWFDREIEFAGRIVDREGRAHLVRTGPFARIPHLAIHLDPTVNQSFGPDRQRELLPVYGVSPAPDLLSHLAQLAGLPVDAIAGHDILAADSAAPARFGADGALFASGRLDNLISVHAALTALLATNPGGPQKQGGSRGANEVAAGAAGAGEVEAAAAPGGARNVGGQGEAIAVLAGFDHEELGSESRSGACGPFLEDVLERVTDALGGTRADRSRAYAKSWCLSLDAAHLVHPGRAERHDPQHLPLPGGGPVLKVNGNQKYTTDAFGTALWKRICSAAGVPHQVFVSNNAVPCGSTIGPLTATRLGIRTLDAGVAILSMHSARELCHTDDPGHLATATRAFYQGE